jgi:EAL domain-containing protein (putative c-di-GMP-specific phosphodiesterase class I)
VTALHPRRDAGAGTLYLWFPVRQARTKAISALRRALVPCGVGEGDALTVSASNHDLRDVTLTITSALTATEIGETRVVYKEIGEPLSVGDFSRIQSLTQISVLEESEWLLDLLAEGRLTSLFQPIVPVDAPMKVFAYEALLRGIDADGSYISPVRVFDGARAAGLLFQLDLAARRTAIASAIRKGVRQNIFVNFAPTSIFDPATGLRATVDAIDEGGISHDRVVFEVVESERTVDADHLNRILSGYRDAGFRVALDDVGAGYSSLNMIHRLRPDFIKLDMDLIRGVHLDPYKALIAMKILEISAGLGIATIVEGIEEEAELEWAREHGATFAQGYYIARPAAEPPSFPADAPGRSMPMAAPTPALDFRIPQPTAPIPRQRTASAE